MKTSKTSQKNNQFQHQVSIDEWCKKKTKLYKPIDLIVIDKYLEYMKVLPEQIKLSSDYVFSIYNIDANSAKKINLRPENICKLSLLHIIKSFKNYFPEITFEILFEKRNETQAHNENINIKKCLIHDAQIFISKKNLDINEQFHVVFEYDEKESHDNVKDSNRNHTALFNLNLYMSYNDSDDDNSDKNSDDNNDSDEDCDEYSDEDNDSDYENNNELNLKYTFKKLIIYIFCIVCTLLNNKHILSKIIFFQNFENLSKDKLDAKTTIFNYMHEVLNSPNKKFDLKKLYLCLSPCDDDGNPYEYKKFVSIVNDMGIDIKYDKKCNLYDTNVFSQIIVFMNNDMSDNIKEYKQIYMEYGNALDRASDKIIEFNRENLEKSTSFQKYLRDYSEHRLIYNRDVNLIRSLAKKFTKAIKKLKKKSK